MVFEGDSIRFLDPSGPAAAIHFVLDPPRKAIDLLVSDSGNNHGAEQAWAGLYELNRNRLLLCFSRPRLPRPKTLDSTASLHTLMILERK